MAALIQVVVLGIAIVLLAGDVVWPITLSTGPVPEYLFAEGLKRYQAGELDGASETWENVFSEPTYGPVAYILLARARQKLNEHAKAETLVQDFLKKHPDSVYQNLGQELLADALYHQNNPKAASLLSHMIAKAPDKDKPGLTLRLAELEKRLGNYPSAASHYRSLFLNYPASVEGLKAGDDLAWMVFHSKVAKPEFSESEQLARGGRLFAKGRFDLAAETYQALLKTKPGDKQLTLKLARCKFKDRQNNKAIAILKEMLKGEVSETDKMEALHLLSLVYWRIDRDKDFELCCNVLTEKAPPKLKRKALFNLGVHHMERKRFADADACFKRLLNTLPEPSMKADVKWKTAWIKYWERKYTDAAAAFGEARILSPGGKLENPSRYWQARCLMAANRAKEAEPLLKEIVKHAPLDYYAEEASRVLKSVGATGIQDRRTDQFPDVTLTPAQKSHALVVTAGKLMEKGLPEFALMNLEALPRSIRSTPAMAFLIAKAAYSSGKYLQAQETLSAVFGNFVENPPENAPGEFIEMSFPRVFFSETMKIAEKHSLDPNLVWAVIRQESRYDPSVVSPAGAMGLMQVTPEAAGIVKKAGKIPPRAIEDILEPRQNIAHGVRILSKNLSVFKGKLVPAVASYNADIKKVKDWLKRNEKMKQDEFIESIPYLETRIYVKRVLAGFRAYSRLHSKKDLAGFW